MDVIGDGFLFYRLHSRELEFVIHYDIKYCIYGLQLADLIAHPSRNEILKEQGFLEKEIGLFAKEVIKILQEKYDQHEGRLLERSFYR